jgi:hypothetical protein
VQEIAEHNETRRTGAREERREPRKIRLRAAARKRNAARAERGSLAEMNVGDEERAGRGPVQRALGMQRHALPAQRGLVDAMRHATAMLTGVLRSAVARRKLEALLRFSANLSFLFNEVPFLERFGEAAHAGFRAVEFAFGYDYQARDIAARVAEHKLEVVLINAPRAISSRATAGSHRCPDASTSSLPA